MRSSRRGCRNSTTSRTADELTQASAATNQRPSERGVVWFPYAAIRRGPLAEDRGPKLRPVGRIRMHRTASFGRLGRSRVGVPCAMGSHRKLTAWQVAHESALAIYRYVDQRWTPARAAAYDQLRHASLSVPLNIAEGCAVGKGARCRFHLRVAHGSSVETTEILRFLADLGEPVAQLVATADRAAALTYRLWQTSRP